MQRDVTAGPEWLQFAEWGSRVDEPYLLLVEENPDDAYLTLRGLQRSSFDLPVRVVSDSGEALDFLREVRRLPEAVIASYRLSRLDGVELIDLLRTDDRTRELPAMLLMGSPEERDHICGTECRTGANACLTKPLDPEQLSEVLCDLEVLSPDLGDAVVN